MSFPQREVFGILSEYRARFSDRSISKLRSLLWLPRTFLHQFLIHARRDVTSFGTSISRTRLPVPCALPGAPFIGMRSIGSAPMPSEYPNVAAFTAKSYTRLASGYS